VGLSDSFRAVDPDPDGRAAGGEPQFSRGDVFAGGGQPPRSGPRGFWVRRRSRKGSLPRWRCTPPRRSSTSANMGCAAEGLFSRSSPSSSSSSQPTAEPRGEKSPVAASTLIPPPRMLSLAASPAAEQTA